MEDYYEDHSVVLGIGSCSVLVENEAPKKPRRKEFHIGF